MSDPPTTELEKSIRALTTAIQLLDPQSNAAKVPIPAKQSNYQALSKAYNHLANLLTQDASRQVAVTGNFRVSGSSVTAVEGIEDLGQLDEVGQLEELSRLDELDQLPPIRRITGSFTQDADKGPNDAIFLKVEGIEPSGKALKDLADPSKKYTPLSRNSH
jgi:hypothetical protein